MHLVIERGKKIDHQNVKIHGIGYGVKKWKYCLLKKDFPPQHGMAKILSLWCLVLQLERYSDYTLWHKKDLYVWVKFIKFWLVFPLLYFYKQNKLLHHSNKFLVIWMLWIYVIQLHRSVISSIIVKIFFNDSPQNCLYAR